MSQVALARCNDYDRAKVREAVAMALREIGGIEQFVKAGEKVLIKPNLLTGAAPEAAVTTHPEVVRAVIEACQAVGATVIVGDSPGFGSSLRAAEKAGILAVCQEAGAEYVPFEEITEVPYPQGALIKRFPLASAVVQADKVISVAKLKTHGLTRYTGAVKNLYGTIVGLNKGQLHLRVQENAAFGRLLLDIYNLVKPVLSIVDGVVGMEGEGPRNGSPRQAGVIIAGADGLAVDAVGAAIIGLTPDQVSYLKAARTAGQIKEGLDWIEVRGLSLAEARVPGFKLGPATVDTNLVPGWLAGLLRHRLTAQPVVDPKACIGCNICGQACPPQTITMRDKTAVINDKNCIRCYCCHEMCPQGAITLKTGWLAKRLTGGK